MIFFLFSLQPNVRLRFHLCPSVICTRVEFSPSDRSVNTRPYRTGKRRTHCRTCIRVWARSLHASSILWNQKRSCCDPNKCFPYTVPLAASIFISISLFPFCLSVKPFKIISLFKHKIQISGKHLWVGRSCLQVFQMLWIQF